jgi:CRP/FNR family cyclic AMP-dependent transcriptional regulator
MTISPINVTTGGNFPGKFRPELTDQLSSYAVTKIVKRGATIFAKGDPGNSLFAVYAGAVKIQVRSARGKYAVFYLLREGDIFGELAWLDGHARSTDAVALTDCELLVIERRNLAPLLNSYPEIALKLIEILCGRLRRISEQVEDVTFFDLPARLAKVLHHLAERASQTHDGRKIVITQRDLGRMIGMSRESTNRQLRSWEHQKWLRLEQGRIVLLMPEAFAAIVAGQSGMEDDPSSVAA